jgi:hypothetical protein
MHTCILSSSSIIIIAVHTSLLCSKFTKMEHDGSMAHTWLKDAPTYVDTYAYPANVCLMCGVTTSVKKCGRCKIPAYCSQPCQRLHWPVHKALCGK